MPEITVKQVKFKYDEQSQGKRRGIIIGVVKKASLDAKEKAQFKKDTKKAQQEKTELPSTKIESHSKPQTYCFEPDPHDDPWYNGGNQMKFYKEAAEEIAELYHKSQNGMLPRYGKKIKVNNVTYTLKGR